jgi:translation initiation factor IF-2
VAEKMRVHLLANELGVPSKAILEKCKAEGLDIRNHMSTLSAGQAATIREWFSEGAHVTTVETSDRVDLQKARAKRKRKKAKKKTETPTAAAVATAEAAPPAEGEPTEATVMGAGAEASVAAAEAPAPTAEGAPPTETVAPPEEETAETPAAVVEPAPPEVPAEPVGADKVAASTAEVPPAEAEAPVGEPPKAPEPVSPAGPQNIPAPAQVLGPQVIRIERPEPVREPSWRSRDRAGEAGAPGVGAPPPATGAPRRGRKGRGEAAEEAAKKRSRVHPRRSGRSEAGERLQEWRDRDLIERKEKIRAASGRGIHARRAVEKQVGPRPPVARKTAVEMTEPIILHGFCAMTGIGLAALAPKLIREHNILPNRNTVLDADLAQLLALDHGIELTVHKAKTPLEALDEEFATHERTDLRARPPVVTLLGHVDHGKTSLLDAIRRTRVVEGESGGITQHIGAYRLDRAGLSVTFLDTPGHEAFTAMRARGANLTDVVVLVVAADDGVMPQTVEAINHAKAANVPIVIALNKVDLPNADRNRAFGQLAEHDLVPQQWGGEVDVIETAAPQGQGIDELVEHLSTLSELLELKADPTVPTCGTVIEAEMKEGVGAVAKVLVQEGTLREGDVIVCGPASGRVRALRDDFGHRIDEAPPGTPVEVAGLDAVPQAGDRFYQLDDLQRAKDVAKSVSQQRRERALVRTARPRTLEDLYSQREAGRIPVLNLILRADVQGSVDVLLKTLMEIPSDEVKLNVLHAAVGGITESDVVLAEASEALIVGFHVVPEPGVGSLADERGVEIKLYRVIYNLTDDIRNALSGLLAPEQQEEFRGRAEVRQVFSMSKIGKVAGCYVTEGALRRNQYVRVLRDGRIIIPTADDAERGRHRALASLRRFKEDVQEVRNGFECGIKIVDYDDIQVGDIIEAYEIVEVARSL